jgi:hypothetical protein
MSTSIFANPGQTIQLAIQVIDGYGSLHDGYQSPTVDFVRMPNGQNASGYPLAMTEIVTGIWKHSLVIPSGTPGLGSYLVSCSWPHPDTAFFQNEIFIIQVSLPFGNSSISPG